MLDQCLAYAGTEFPRFRFFTGKEFCDGCRGALLIAVSIAVVAASGVVLVVSVPISGIPLPVIIGMQVVVQLEYAVPSISSNDNSYFPVSFRKKEIAFR